MLPGFRRPGFQRQDGLAVTDVDNDLVRGREMSKGQRRGDDQRSGDDE